MKYIALCIHIWNVKVLSLGKYNNSHLKEFNEIPQFVEKKTEFHQ